MKFPSTTASASPTLALSPPAHPSASVLYQRVSRRGTGADASAVVHPSRQPGRQADRRLDSRPALGEAIKASSVKTARERHADRG